jgi:predicted PurR-regulated permease PerM
MEHPPSNRFSGPNASWIRAAGFVLVAAILLWLLSKVWLIAFASILMAIALCGLAKPITDRTKIPHALAVVLVAIALIGVIGWPFIEFGSKLWAQFDEIALDIPKAIGSIKETVEAHPSIQFLEQVALDMDFSKVAAPVAAHLTAIVTSVGTIMAYATLLLFGGIYLALDPELYSKGTLRLLPESYRGRAEAFTNASASSLRTWLLTQLVVVLINGIFAGVGLWALGVDGAAALAMLGGLLSFIPYVGTIVAMIIGALAALPQGTDHAFYVLLVFSVATIVEGYFITPYLQSKTLSLPPVVLIFAIFAFGILFGTLGVVLAAPMTVVLMTALETFYRPAILESR